MNNLIGKIVCGYRITSEIGEGGMGKVYLAESAFLTEYKQLVAIKTLTTFASTERQATILRDLFTREANIQVQFKHEYIVSVIQFAVEGDQYFLILEYMPGYQHRGRRLSNVADVITHETGPIPHRRALIWFIQALDAMQYAHNFKYRWEGEERVGIVHRDIKPANLLLMNPETIKVSDFGIVKVRQRRGAITQKLTPGTSAYMSPEAILGPQNFGMTELDARSDIYSLGVTLYEMLAGRLPFAPDPETNPEISLRRKHVNETPPPPSAFYPGIPAQLDQLVLRALEKRPENRYQSADEFKRAILALDSSLGLDLREKVTARAFDTNPLSLPTEKMDSDTTASGAAVSTASRSSGRSSERRYDPAATSVMSTPAQTQSPTPATTFPGSSKQIWLIGVSVLLIGAMAAGLLFKNRDRARSSSNNIGVQSSPNNMGGVNPLKNSPPPGMVQIPEGSFMLGRDLTDAEKSVEIAIQGRKENPFVYDYPANEKQVNAFYLDKTELSNREYAEFVKATGHAPPENWNGQQPPENAENIPVTNVNYQDAVDYCRWRAEQRKDGVSYRLPTEEEWEYAARGKDAGKPDAPMNLYPWGDQWGEGMANTREARLGHPRNVDSYPDSKSPFDVFNLAGNVFEWTATDFNHYQGSDRKTPREPGYTGTYQVVRGGSFDYPKEYAMTTTRVWARPTNKGPRLGFRCAADAKQ
ncbi:MAG: bifunctional serine/threonine-protein kinase/formylglycine-generating enzyme family protein [Acidobacteria bacterium]|nr:bifunctional serine/threonine-protein kinase/formylglycine-generating enzyme family protein [Acidobacteriota bacterium]MCI0660012.1 bifunctional serine/threonine-protein kinase/formylglycine-generating enzyme family protein [Acidobacteriota bacterium]